MSRPKHVEDGPAHTEVPGAQPAPGTPESGLAGMLAGGNTAMARLLGGGQVRRCGPVPCDCDDEERLEYARTHRHASGEHSSPTPPPAFVTAMGAAGPGQPLADGFRAEAETRFGTDFSGVRVHTGAAANEAAESISAYAFTVGNDVFFAPGQYRPGDDAGKQLLAHELTHVVQGGGPQAYGSWLSQPDDPSERAAVDAADRFMAGASLNPHAMVAGAAVGREPNPAPAAAPADSAAIVDAVRADDVATIVRLLTGKSIADLNSIRAAVRQAVGTGLENWLLGKLRGGEALGSLQRGLSVLGAVASPVGALAAAAGASLGGSGPSSGGQAEQGIRILWPSMTLVEKLQLYDEGWRELEQAQLDVIRLAGPDERAAAQSNGDARRILERVYGLMDPTEEYQARSLMNPTPDGRYDAAQHLLNRAQGVLSDAEDAVFDAFMDLQPPQRKRLYDENLLLTARIFSDERRTLLRNLAYGSEAQALIARLKEATEGRSDDMAAVQKVVEKAVALLQERAALRASLGSTALPTADRAVAEARLAELNDLDQLLTFNRGSDGKLDGSSFLGMLSAARGDARAFAADASQLGQFATGERAEQHAFETAKERILLSDGNVDAIQSAIIGLHAQRTAAPTPGGPSPEEQQADQRLRQRLLDDPAVAAVINSLTGTDRMRVTGAVTADAYDEAKAKLADALAAADWGTFFRGVLAIARRPEWCAKFRSGATSALDVYAQVHGDQRTIMETILNTQRVPIDALLLFTGDADVLAAVFGDMDETERSKLRTGYMLTQHPPSGSPTTEQNEALTAFRTFDGQLHQRWRWYQAPLNPAEYQKVLWAALGHVPTEGEATDEGRFQAAELMYQQQQGQLGLDRRMAQDFTEADETMVAAARGFASRFEPLRPQAKVTPVDFSALSAYHEQFLGRSQEYTDASNTVSEMAGVVAATVAGAVVVAATGGAATPAVIALAAAAGAGSRVITQEMFGGDYNQPDARQALLGAVDGALAVVSGSLAARGAQLMGVGGQALAKGAARLAGQVAEEASGTAVRLAPSMARRMAASAVESALDGAFSGAVSEAFGKLTDPATWRRGVWSGLVQVGEAAIAAGLVGLTAGGVIGGAMPVVGAAAGRVWDAVVGQGIEQALAKAGATPALNAAREAARAGNVAEVNRLLAELEAHLSAPEANALRQQLNAELRLKLGHPPGTAGAKDEAQRLLLHESGAIEDGTQLRRELREPRDVTHGRSADLACPWFDVVARSEPQISTVEGYVDEVDLGNGHTWRRSEKDLTWCRFSRATKCGSHIEGVRAPTQAAIERMRGIQAEIDILTRDAGLDRQLEIDFNRVRARLSALGRTGTGRINFDALSEAEREVLRQVFDQLDDDGLRRLTGADLKQAGDALEASAARAVERETVKLGQLRDEGAPLYDRLRARTPRGRGRDTVLKRSGGLDEMSQALPPSGSVDVDHVHALALMVQDVDFVSLPFPHQVTIANHPDLLKAVDSSLNRSRGSRPWTSDWPRRSEYSAAALARAADAEERAIARFHELIAEMRAKPVP